MGSDRATIANPYHRQVLISAIVGLAVFATGLTFLLLFLLLGRHWFEADAVVGVIIMVFSLLALIPFFFLRAQARRVDAFLRNIERGEYLARWDYRREEWLAFQRVDSSLWRKKVLKRMAWVGGMSAVGLAVPYFLIVNDHPEDRGTAGLIMLGIGLLIPIVLLGMYWALVRRRARGLALTANPPTSYVTPDCAYANGEFILWGTPNLYLNDVRLLTGPPMMLEFVVRAGNDPDAMLSRRVLVPAGREHEVEQVLRTFRDRD